jgi:alkylation response protein AidB-like acyl-CoA dehydrogenase
LGQFAHSRVPTNLGQPIASLPHVQHAVGQMASELAAARAWLFSLLGAWQELSAQLNTQPNAQFNEQRRELLTGIGAAKVLATNAAIRASDLALRTAGGAALTNAWPLERLFRDARAGLAHPPSDHTGLAMLGEQVLGSQLPGSPALSKHEAGGIV